MLNIAVFVSGGGTNLQAIIDAIEDGRITNTNIKAVISDKEDAYALTRAKEHNILGKVINPKNYSGQEEYSHVLIKELEELEVHFIVLAGYLKIIPKQVVQAFCNKIINVHPSLIPAFCGDGFYGLRVHEAVLNRGVKVTGATVHFVDEGTDTGPIILQKAVEVHDDDTKESLQKRVMEEAEWNILPQAIHMIANEQLEIVDNIIKKNKK